MASDRDRLLKAFIGASKKRRKPGATLQRPVSRSGSQDIMRDATAFTTAQTKRGGSIRSLFPQSEMYESKRRGVNFKPAKGRGDRDIVLRRADQNYPNAAPFFVPGLSEAARKRSRMKRPRRLGRSPSTRPSLNKRPTLN